jgi:hypothetical protein
VTVISLDGKEHLSDLFNKLRSGRHLCADDGPLYLALRADYATYRTLFAALGFELREHERGFYYFRATDDLGKEAAQFAVFFFVLVEAWGDAGKDLEASAFDPAGHALSELPHLTRDSWRQCMTEAGVSSADELTKVVQSMDRLGFTERIGDDRFRFRAPAWRFFDLCAEVLAESERPTIAETPEEGA